MATRNFFLSTFFASEEDLVTRILGYFLTVNDFYNLDTSICNHEHRKSFLKCSVSYCYDGSGSIPLGVTFLTWARRRHISVRKLCWKVDSKFSSSILRGLMQKSFMESDISQTSEVSLHYHIFEKSKLHH
jgi:hypothetical protein